MTQKKAFPNSGRLFVGYNADLDAKPCVADLDARWFCRGYGNPLAMMGVALDRYLPGRNAMLANESYVFNRILTTNGLCILTINLSYGIISVQQIFGKGGGQNAKGYFDEIA